MWGANLEISAIWPMFYRDPRFMLCPRTVLKGDVMQSGDEATNTVHTSTSGATCADRGGSGHGVHEDGAVGTPPRRNRRGPSRRTWAVFLALVIGLGLPVVSASSAAAATTWTVPNVNDSGPGSLRQAITNADNGSGGDTIAFDIPGTGPFIISPASDLPILNVPVTIDGYTQPGSSPATATSPAQIEIQIDGGGTLDNGLVFDGPGGMTTVKGLSITNFTGVETGLAAGTAVVEGNYLGLAADGTTEGASGVDVDDQSAFTALIGGTTPAARNVMDAGVKPALAGVLLLTGGVVVEGNWIGNLNAAGTVGLGNDIDVCGSRGRSDTRIAGNVLTGSNTLDAVDLRPASCGGDRNDRSRATSSVRTLPARPPSAPSGFGIVGSRCQRGSIGTDTPGSGNVIGSCDHRSRHLRQRR